MSAEVIGSDGRIKDRQGVPPQGVVFRAKRTSQQVCANNVWVDFKPDLKQFDPFGYYDPSTGRFQPKIAGYYRLSAVTYQTAGNSTTWTYFRLAKNGGPPNANGVAARSQQQFGANFQFLGGTVLWYFNGTTDYATVQVQSDNYATGGGVFGDNLAEDYSWFEAELIGVTVGVIPEPWHFIGGAGEPAFQNGWSNRVGNAHATGFFKDPYGIVHIEGHISGGTTTAGTLIFTLPAGYRPAQTIDVPAINDGGIHQVDIGPDGQVKIYPSINAIVATGVYLDGISFRAG